MTTTTDRPDTLAEAQAKLERREALAEEANYRQRRDELRARLHRGAQAIADAKAAGAQDGDVRDAENRLAGLQAELNELLRAFEVPLYVAQLVVTVAEDARRWGVDLPPDCHITISVPGMTHRSVALRPDEPEVPF